MISGTGSVTKDGSGKLVLSGANTATGSTTVSGGRLSINGSLASLAVSGSGGELGGSGTNAGSVSIGSGASFAAGNCIESISADATTFDYELDSTNRGSLGTAADLLVFNGDLDITAAAPRRERLAGPMHLVAVRPHLAKRSWRPLGSCATARFCPYARHRRCHREGVS